MIMVQIIIPRIFVYLTIFVLSIIVLTNDYNEDRITLFEMTVLSLFWPITLPYKLIKTLIKAIKKI